jgi:hypothetical protein
VPPLDVGGTTPILLVGEGEQVQGEVWLSNPTAADIIVKSATLSVTLPSGVESGPIGLPPDAAVPAFSTRRLVIGMGMQPLTPPGTYEASVDLAFEPPLGSQKIPARVLVNATFAPVLVPLRIVFSKVASNSKRKGSVVVVNKGNVDIPVGPMGTEPLLEVRSQPRVLVVAAGGAVSVEPAIASAAAGKTVQFTNDQPTVGPGGWAEVKFELTTPAGLTPNAHLRALPRLATERFAVDLLTGP